jgi:hypothetical protein
MNPQDLATEKSLVVKLPDRANALHELGDRLSTVRHEQTSIEAQASNVALGSG